MKIGYARVSTREQNLDMQLKAFEEAGCEKIFKERISGTSENLPELSRMLEQLRKGDQVYVWALDRLGRTVLRIINTVALINGKDAELVIVTQNIDTGTAVGKVFVTVFALLAELETELRRERQLAGIKAARLKGITGGRKKGLSTESIKKAELVKELYTSANPYSIRKICDMLHISSRTVYAYLSYLNVPKRGEEE
jgi:DNA invertase Pin-like site-specific DNA recombinase